MATLSSKKKALALATSGVLALAISGSAQAYVMASSVIQMTNFLLTDENGDTLDFVDDFSGLTFTNTAGYTVDYTGYPTLTDSISGSTGVIDFLPACTGPNCSPILPDNSYPTLTAAPTGGYSAADQSESGAPISNIPGFTEGADVANGSWVAVSEGDAFASSVSDNNLNSSWVFSPTGDGTMTFEFDVEAYMQVAVSADELFPGFATASYDFSFSLINLSNNGEVILSWSPDLYDDGNPNTDPLTTISLNAPLPIDLEILKTTGGVISFDRTVSLNSGDFYQLSARMETNVDAERVPVPFTLGLVGLGLVGIGALRNRRRKS